MGVCGTVVRAACAVVDWGCVCCELHPESPQDTQPSGHSRPQYPHSTLLRRSPQSTAFRSANTRPLHTAGTQRAVHTQPSEHTRATAHAALPAAHTHIPQGPQQPLGCQGERHSQKLHGALVKRGSLHGGLQGASMTSKSPHVTNKRSRGPSKGSMKTGRPAGALCDRRKKTFMRASTELRGLS